MLVLERSSTTSSLVTGQKGYADLFFGHCYPVKGLPAENRRAHPIKGAIAPFFGMARGYRQDNGPTCSIGGNLLPSQADSRLDQKAIPSFDSLSVLIRRL